MKVERNNYNSVTPNIKGITGVSETIIITDGKEKENFNLWVEDCVKLVEACSHTLKETEQYLLGKCETLPIALDDVGMKYFKLNVILNYCGDKLT